jgi:hypothetical protein
MGSEFLVYLRLGFEHISDLNGYDHILFIAALCAVYQLGAWKHLLWLVTAFTIGHSITLALATLDLVRINSDLIEFLIPVTILLASLVNLVERRAPEGRRAEYAKYAMALGFGLIHGMGFSNYLRAILFEEESLFVPLLAFNVGLELGQITILFVLLLAAYAAVRFLKMPPREWAVALSGAAAGIALTMMVERIP